LPANARRFCGKTTECVFRDSPDAYHDSAVLDRIVRIKKPRSDGTNLWPLDMLGHDREPIAVDHFSVVV
jgi:hypothetical protein